jgi:hypothetical protein
VAVAVDVSVDAAVAVGVAVAVEVAVDEVVAVKAAVAVEVAVAAPLGSSCPNATDIGGIANTLVPNRTKPNSTPITGAILDRMMLLLCQHNSAHVPKVESLLARLPARLEQVRISS